MVRWFVWLGALITAFSVQSFAQTTPSRIPDSERRGFIGVTFQIISAGALVHEVVVGGPAHQAGIAPGDVILELDGKAVKTANDMTDPVARAAPGTKVVLRIWRKNEYLNVVTTIADAQEFYARPSQPAEITSETAGDLAAERGDLRGALAQYIVALNVPGVDEMKVREKVIKLVQRLDPPPAVPEAAERHMIRAATAEKIAKSDKDAIEELEKALRLAPWLADGYYNLAILKQRANDYAGAIASFKLYLLTPRAAVDGPEVRKKIVALEYLLERQSKEGVQAKESEAGSALLQRLSGAWRTRKQGIETSWELIVTGGNEFKIMQYQSAHRGLGALMLKFGEYTGAVEGNKMAGKWIAPVEWRCATPVVPVTYEVAPDASSLVVHFGQLSCGRNWVYTDFVR